ncbi:acetate--CoA ligase family protein [Arthrobacter sp. I2-34]|uniref:Acetate--CoA ligase family protein n=1 Tax=Arthrobacter hankyongi TaxID=2904801 RepID=A0ABS9L9Y6_9MICC|nr:acetate--CoA ligase family protein [Arthrobacter hankyongi]MCG2623406.1 acetate--CoA ligase family protein [Arthrobacter hankyongi]
MTDQGLKGFFTPDNVALIGASESSGWTAMLLEGLAASAAPPQVHFVNPRSSTVHGRAAFATVAEIPGVVDLAFVLVGPDRVLGVVRDCLDAGIRDFVVLSSGLGESSAYGTATQELAELCAMHEARLLGPNVSGFVDLARGTALFGLAWPPHLLRGSVGLAMQSGGLATHALSLCAQWGIGVSRLVTTGNEVGITVSDVLDDFADDPDTSVVVLFLESIRDPERFRQAAVRAREAGKAVVALHVGSSELGRTSALAHTGALVGDHATAIAALEGTGVACVKSLEELIAAAGLLARHPEGLPGSRLAVVAASGGACELIADSAQRLGLALPPLPDSVQGYLGTVLPAESTARNPLDVTGFVVKEPELTFQAVAGIAAHAAGDYDALVFQSVLFPAEDAVDDPAVRERFRRLGELVRSTPLPVLLQTAGTFSLSPRVAELVAGNGLFVLPGIAVGMRAIAAAAHSARLRAGARNAETPAAGVLPAGAGDVAAAMRDCGVPTPPARVVATAEEAAAAAAEIGFPVAVKLVSPDVAHKSDVGGVALGLRDAAAVRGAVAGMQAAVRRARPDARIEGYQVVAMRPAGIELLVSVTQDATWGPMLTVGSGGVLTEVLEDVVVRPLSLDPAVISQMLGQLRIARLFPGYRGAPAADLDAAVAAVQAIGRLALRLGPAARAVEVNPLWLRGKQAEALDLLVDWA